MTTAAPNPVAAAIANANGIPVAALPDTTATPAANTPPATIADGLLPATPNTQTAESQQKTDTGDPQVVEYEYEPTGDAGLDIVLAFLGKNGLGADSPQIDQAMQGNFTYLEAFFAGKGDKAPAGWQQYMVLAKDSYERTLAAEKSTAEDRTKLIHDKAGGKEVWDAISAFAQEKYGKDEKAYKGLRDALAGTEEVATAIVQSLYNEAMEAGRITKTGAAVTGANVGTVPASSGGGLITDRAEYRAEQAALISKFGIARYSTTPEYAALQARCRF